MNIKKKSYCSSRNVLSDFFLSLWHFHQHVAPFLFTA